MRRYILSMLILMILFLFAFPARADDEWQYWSSWMLTHKLSNVSAMSILAEVYFRDNMRNDYVYDEYLTYTRQMGNGFGIICQAYFEAVEQSGGSWSSVRSLVAGPTYTFTVPNVCRVKLQDRFYYRLNSTGGWDYHRPRIYLTRDFGRFGVSLSDELRIDLSGDRHHNFFRNRVYTTLSCKVSSSATLSLSHVHQADRQANGDWRTFDVLQTMVSFAI
jgi:hypothetical protein